MPDRKKAHRVLRGLRWALLPLMAAAFAAVSWGMYRLAVRGEDIEVHVYPVDRESVPAWLPEKHIKELELMAAQAVQGRSYFDPGLAEAVATALGKSHWTLWDEFQDSEGKRQRRPRVKVRRCFPSGVSCEIVIREPFAGVQVRDGNTFVIDNTTVQLPLWYRKGEAVPLPVIRGARTYPPGPGNVWRDRAVEAGAQVIRTLDPLVEDDELLALEAVEVTVAGRLPAATLHTVSGLQIAWGVVYQPGKEPAGLHGAEERIKALDRFLGKTDPAGIEHIDASGLPISFKPKTQ